MKKKKHHKKAKTMYSTVQLTDFCEGSDTIITTKYVQPWLDVGLLKITICYERLAK